MINRARSLLSLGFLLLGGCATPPEPTPVRITPARLPFPTYVTHGSAAAFGGASWRGGRTEHALDPDGPWCGITFEGRARCRRSPPE